MSLRSTFHPEDRPDFQSTFGHYYEVLVDEPSPPEAEGEPQEDAQPTATSAARRPARATLLSFF